MTLWPWVPWLAFAASVLAVAGTTRQLAQGCTVSKGALRMWVAAAGLSLASLLYLVSRFLAADLSVSYVFLYTRADLPWPWRLAGTWAGREGSLLLWGTALAVTTAALAWMHHRRRAEDEAEERARIWTRWFLGLFLAAFLLAVALQDTFAATGADLLAGRPLGNGLNPSLKSGFILIHPPMMFVAYAIATVPAAAVLAHLVSGTDRWSRVALTSSRVGWLLFTFAMGLGAMWAYYTLGFGGYWAWDPVEVANLLPWLAFTLYLHAQLHHLKHGSYRVAGPLLGILPFLLTLFSTISTRSGLWVSVHAFTDPTDTFDPDPAGRFLDILRVEPSLAFPVALFLATLLVFLALWCRRLALESGRLLLASRAVAGFLGAVAGYALVAPASALSLVFEAAHRLAAGSTGYGLLGLTFGAVLLGALPALLQRPGPEPSTRALRIDLRTLAAYSIAVLALSLLVLFLFHMAAVNGWRTSFYEDRFPWLATPVLLGLLVLQGHGSYGRARSVGLAAGAWAAAGAGALLVRGHAGGAYLAILAGALVLVSLDKVRRAGTAPNTPTRARLAATLTWVAALFDVLLWVNPPTRLSYGPIPFHVDLLPQLLFLALALLALWRATRMMAGCAVKPRATMLAVALLHGFYVAPVLVAAAFLLLRGQAVPTGPLDAKARARLRQVGLYAVHLALAVALLGYAPSTYFKDKAHTTLAIGQSVEFGGHGLRYVTTAMEGPAAGFPADVLLPTFDVLAGGKAVGSVQGRLEWEPQAQAHFPLPATWRTAAGDLYVEMEAVHVAAGGSCLGDHPEGVWVEAYKASLPGRVCAGSPIDQVRLTAVSLPGLSVVWLALALGVSSMAVLLFVERRDPRG
jgi:cytochrome c-type biogenesis protein CcmF